MADEIELKLELSSADAERMLGSKLFADDAKTVKQVATYFDTGDHAVAKAGLSLRIRRTGDVRIQTIKADGPSAVGLFVRTEWERSVDSDTPHLDHTTPLPMMLGDAVDQIAPIFDVRVERRKWIMDEEGTSIEVVLDRGEVAAGEHLAPICEIELELKLGDPAALFGLARRIDAIVPVRLGVVTKSERGYRLIPAPQASIKALTIALPSDGSTADAFRHIVQSCIRQFRLNEDLLFETRDPKALHQARVAIRRLRSAFSIFKPMIGDAGAGLGEELRWLAACLGDVRDLDVLLGRAPSGALHEQIAAARETAYDALFDILAGDRARAIMLNIVQFLAQSRWADEDGFGAQPARLFATTVLARLRRRIKRRSRAIAGSDDEARHDVRKDAKKLRYASEFFGSLFSRKREQRRQKRFVAALEGLQDRLGTLNDLVTARDVMTRHGWIGQSGADALLPSDRGRKKLLQQADDAYDELFDTKRFW